MTPKRRPRPAGSLPHYRNFYVRDPESNEFELFLKNLSQRSAIGLMGQAPLPEVTDLQK